MKKIAIASALFSVFSLTTGTVNAYQAEIGASAAYVDPDKGSSGSDFGINGTYYFNPVQTRNSPLAEAAFLDRASNVNVHANFADRGDTDDNTYGAAIGFFIPNSDFYLGAGIDHNKQKWRRNGAKLDWDTTYYNAEVGYFLAPSLLIAAGLKGYDNDNDDGVDPTIRAKLITQLGGRDLNLEAGAAFGDLDEYNLAADYYIDKTVSVGADYYKNDLTDVSEFGISASKFFTPQISLAGRIGFGEQFNNDYNSFGITGKYRF